MTDSPRNQREPNEAEQKEIDRIISEVYAGDEDDDLKAELVHEALQDAGFDPTSDYVTDALVDIRGDL